jgi:hypothetical protein
MFACTEHRSWMDIRRFADSRGKDWTYVIFGKGGPTGKTYLCNSLRANGYNAIELSEDICGIVECHDNENHYLVYEHNKCLVIILNKRLPHHIYPGNKED